MIAAALAPETEQVQQRARGLEQAWRALRLLVLRGRGQGWLAVRLPALQGRVLELVRAPVARRGLGQARAELRAFALQRYRQA